jgi:hypothetical protein
MEEPRIDPTQVVGWAVDADPANNPTSPMRDVSKDDHAGMSWNRPVLQNASVEVLYSNERPGLSAVFGTPAPPYGASGALRRIAFTKSEGKWGHWLILMAADRLNVLEGLMQDLAKGKLPNLFVERGFRADWRYSRPSFYKRTGACAMILLLIIVSGTAKRAWSRRR